MVSTPKTFQTCDKYTLDTYELFNFQIGLSILLTPKTLFIQAWDEHPLQFLLIECIYFASLKVMAEYP